MHSTNIDGTNSGGHRGILVAALIGSALATLTACGGDARPAGNAPAEAHVAEAPDGTGDARATAAHDVAVAQAEGAHSVALERCDTLAGDARNACRDRADSDLELAKSRAKEALDART